jgi:hypothetical protein
MRSPPVGSGLAKLGVPLLLIRAMRSFLSD